MLQFFIGLQLVAVIVSLIALLFIFKRVSAREHFYLVLLMLVINISNIGYCIELLGTNVDRAFGGTAISYMGKCFISYTLFLYSVNVCKIKVPEIIKNLLFLVHWLVYMTVVTSYRFGLYYTGMRYETEGYFPHVVYDHGIVYYIFMAMQITYFIVCVFMMLRVYSKEKDETQKKRIRTLILIMCISGAGLLLFFTGICQGFDTTSIGYTAIAVILFYTIIYEDFMGTVEFAKDVIVDSMNMGIAVTDKNGSGIYTNQTAQKVIDLMKNDVAEDCYKEIARYAKAGIRREYEGHIYQFGVQELEKDEQLTGYIYNIQDVTEDARYAEILENAITEKTSDVKRMQHSIIASFADMVEARDTVTGAHVKNTCAYVRIIINGLLSRAGHDGVINRQYAQDTIDAAPLHDIGKIAVSDNILKKPGKLTDEEFEQIKAHSKTGAEIIEHTLAAVEEPAYLVIARDMALYHHERWDGKGYPEGKSGEEIPLCARVMAIADVYDALRSRRSYKEPFTKEKSRMIIKEGAGTQFDPVLVDIFLENIEEIEAVDEA